MKKTVFSLSAAAMLLLPALAPAELYDWSYAATGVTCAVGGCLNGTVAVNVTASGTLDTAGIGPGQIIDGSGTRTITAQDGSTDIFHGSGTDTFTQNVFIAPLIDPCTYGSTCVFKTKGGANAIYDNVLLPNLELDGNGIILTDGVSGDGYGGFGNFVSYVSGPGGPSGEFTDVPNNAYFGGNGGNIVQDFTAVDVPTATPEPATFFLAGIALIGLGSRRRKSTDLKA